MPRQPHPLPLDPRTDSAPELHVRMALIRQHQQQLIAESEAQRLRAVLPRPDPRSPRLRRRLARLLVALGTWLEPETDRVESRDPRMA